MVLDNDFIKIQASVDSEEQKKRLKKNNCSFHNILCNKFIFSLYSDKLSIVNM